MVKKQRVALGDIVAIPLPDGRFAFGRLFESGLGVYARIGSDVSDVPKGERRFLFIAGTAQRDLNSGDWPKVGKDVDLPKEALGWEYGYIQDAMTGNFTKYDHASGNSITADRESCLGLEAIACWGANHIVDRIMAALRRKPSQWLAYAPWVPDVIVLGSNGLVESRIPFEEWANKEFGKS